MKLKIIFALLLLFNLVGTKSFTQNSFLKIKAVAPNKLKLGQSFILKASVAHNFKVEKTGGLTCTLLNAKTHVPVDGWFINIFPFQYFTTILNTPFETEFSFTVPNDYKGNFEINLVATVDQIKDNIHFLVPTYK
jgi:phosphorylcholine metabolism protein LicD